MWLFALPFPLGWLPGVLGLAVLVAAGCAPRLRVGVVLPETGDASVYGTSIRSGAALAFKQLQATEPRLAGLEVLYRDSGSDPARASSAAEALLEEGALLLIGGATSAEAKAMIPVAERRRRVLLSPSASAPALSRVSGYFFRVFPSDELEGVAAADFLVAERQVRRVLVVAESNEYTRGLLPVFVSELQAHGAQIVATVAPRGGVWEPELKSVLTAHRPDGAYICGYSELILAAVRALRAAGYGGLVCTTSAVHTATLLQSAGRELEGVVLPLAGMAASSGDLASAFVESYRKAYNLAPDIYAGHGYDAALAAGLALLEGAPGSAAAVRPGLRSLEDRHGVMGPLAFDELGNVKHTLRMYQVRGGRLEPLPVVAEGETP